MDSFIKVRLIYRNDKVEYVYMNRVRDTRMIKLNEKSLDNAAGGARIKSDPDPVPIRFRFRSGSIYRRETFIFCLGTKPSRIVLACLLKLVYEFQI